MPIIKEFSNKKETASFIRKLSVDTADKLMREGFPIAVADSNGLKLILPDEFEG